jgi:hypothetical protein
MAWVMRVRQVCRTGAVDFGSFGGRPGAHWWHDLNRFGYVMDMRNVWKHNLSARQTHELHLQGSRRLFAWPE